MKIALDELNIKKSIEINEQVLYDDSIDSRIKGLDNAYVKGSIEEREGIIYVKLNFEGEMLIIDSLTLEVVPYHFSLNIDENLDILEENYENVYEKSQNILDLKELLWQNIVLEVPISYTKEKDAHLKGDGWELKNDNVKSSSVDPRLKKLEDLLKGDD